jgi:3-dehydroquinate synthase
MTIRSSSSVYEIVRISFAELPECGRGAYFITDERVASCFPELLPPDDRLLVVPSGESSKSLACFGQCLSWLAARGASRSSTVVALGGGVIGDLVGFVASAYMRGVPYLQVPTTLLAQVDSSVGGKVAIDLPEGKNLAGAFYPPAKVLLGEQFLSTLPPRQIKNGLGEVLKYGFISNPGLLEMGLVPGLPALREIVDECIRIKAEIVEEDEFETKGIRAALNFGHTVAHAVEVELEYAELLHGEAVSVGMVAEARLGELLGVSPSGTAKIVADTLLRAGLPTFHPAMNQADSLIEAMYRDKKARNGKLTFSLLSKIGGCTLISGVSEKDVRAALSA